MSRRKIKIIAMTFNNLKNLSILFVMLLAFNGCEKTEDTIPPIDPYANTIVIDANSAFNMQNFKTCIEQIFIGENLFSVIHETENSKLIKTKLHSPKHGKFGKDIIVFTHNYDDKGILTSSSVELKNNKKSAITKKTRSSASSKKTDMNSFVIKYWFDSEGMIKAYFIDNLYYYELEYNINKQLVKETEVIVDEIDRIEEFEYNALGELKTIYYSEGDRTVLSYANGLIVKSSYFSTQGNPYIIDFEYNSDGLLIKQTQNNRHTIFEYGEDTYSILDYDTSGQLMIETKIGMQLVLISYSFYYYDLEGNFTNLTLHECNTEGKVVKISYINGSIDTPELVGYSLIVSRVGVNDRKTQESFYSANGTKLYTAEYTVEYDEDWAYITDTTWFTADGSVIERSQIYDTWVLEIAN